MSRLRNDNTIKQLKPTKARYMTVVANTWREFLAAIDKVKLHLKFEEGEECFMRGHANQSWNLLPSLGRVVRTLADEDALALEAASFWEFNARAQELYDRAQNDWEHLFHMRHHGVITRLLDWTETLSVALYFALDDNSVQNDSDPCIWLLNPYALNEQTCGPRDLVHPRYLSYGFEDWDYGAFLVSKGVRWPGPIAIYPEQTNRRMHAQRAWFTIFGWGRKPLEVPVPKAVAEVVLKTRAVEGAQEFLEHAGVGDYFVVQDLDGLANELHRKYGLGEAIKPMPKGSAPAYRSGNTV